MAVISISVTLLVILCALYFQMRIKDQNPAPLVKWSAYLVVWVALGLLFFQLARGGAKMWHRKMCSNTECTAGVHQNHSGRSKGQGGKHGDCCAENSRGDYSGMDCCNEKMGKKRKKMKGEENVIRESSFDTVDGKIIMKETEIIERKE